MPDYVSPSLDPNKNTGYPSISILPNLDGLKVMTSPFPRMMSSVLSSMNTGYPCHASLPDLATEMIQAKPYPRMMPGLDEEKNTGYPSFSGFIDLNHLYVQSSPFPKMMPRMSETTDRDKGYPSIGHNEPGFGAFANAISLKKITIPVTVKYIADYAFYNTQLAKVKIARDCIYFEHTFPPECEIQFYE